MVKDKIFWTTKSSPSPIPVKFIICKPASSSRYKVSISSITGASFKGAIKTSKLTFFVSSPPFAVPPSSWTTTFIVAVPLAPSTVEKESKAVVTELLLG